MTCRALSFCLVILYSAFSPSLADEAEEFGIRDYFGVWQIVEIAISSDGDLVAYVVERQSLENNKTVRRVYVQSTAPNAEPILIESIQDARELSWVPESTELAFLSGKSGVVQVYSIDARSKTVGALTKTDVNVLRFEVAPSGSALAFLTQADPNIDPESYYTSEYEGRFDILHHGNQGVVIDSDNTYLFDFVNPNWPDVTKRPENRLWLLTDDVAEAVDVPGRVKDFHWSPDGKFLSVVYVDNKVPDEAFFDRYTSVGVYDLSKKKLNTVARAQPRGANDAVVYYSGGEWIPGSGSLHLRRISERDTRFRDAHWTLFDHVHEGLKDSEVSWRPIEHLTGDEFIATSKDRLYLNRTHRAVDALYTLADDGLERAPMIRDLEGAVTNFDFSADHKSAAFSNENLTTPPEVFLWRDGVGIRALTNLNVSIATKRMPAAREISWDSTDGTTIHGWLLTPNNEASKPWPLVAFVHGGPGIPVRNEFSSYFMSGLWPYPFETYALNGIAVFLPNYRGTWTYGASYSDPIAIDGEPIEDIVSGIEHLIANSIADPNRLAISGHSHGSWLGPLTMTRTELFIAGSFAEGPGNFVALYDLMSGHLNRVNHDLVFGNGDTLYDNVQRYVDLSPQLQFDGLENTAVLFEAGVQSAAVAMLGYPKAAAHAGMPTEFVVYPQTSHNIQLPQLKKESAERNLDWFRFWLQGVEDPEPTKADQYRRWREMWRARCTREGFAQPAYCNTN